MRVLHCDRGQRLPRGRRTIKGQGHRFFPALNEEATISSVIADLRTRGFRRVCVIDNGSCDDTAARARLSGAEVISEPRRGYGRACWTGLQNLPSNVEWILFCDADGSSDLRDLERMVSAASR